MSNGQNANQPSGETFLSEHAASELLQVPVKSLLHIKGVAKLAYHTESGARVFKLEAIKAIAEERKARKVAARNPVPQNAVVLDTAPETVPTQS
jgi:hypothetical protein